MKKNIGFKKNIIYAFMAQFVSLFLSLFMSLVVPKILGLEQYGYWQLFLFYAGYISFSLLGLNDGIYLRVGGSNYNDLEFEKIGMQYKLAICFQAVAALIITAGTFLFVENTDRIWVIGAVSVFMIINNATGFLSSILQAVNRTYQYSTSVMIEKAFFIALLLTSVFAKNISYKVIILGYTVSRVSALIYSVYHCREILFSKFQIKWKWLLDMFQSMRVGLVLVVSNVASSLILGIGRIFIDMQWGVAQFAKISFSLSITNFFLQFINQVSMVLFPTLRLVSEEKRTEVYDAARVLLSHILTGILVFYVPAAAVLNAWLPEYQESLKYLMFTLVICIFDGKMQMLYTTYMKVLRKERELLLINAISVTLSAVLCFIGAGVLNNFLLVVIFMTVSIAIRSIISELYVGKILNIRHHKLLLSEIILSCLFIGITWSYSGWKTFALYLILYGVSLVCNRKKIGKLVAYIGKR